MAYDFYMGKILLPVAPKKLQIKIGNTNKTYTLINEGEINVLKNPELTEISFEILLPNIKHPFARYKKGFKAAKYYLDKFEDMKLNKKTFQFIVTRELPNGKSLYDTNMKVSLEDYSITEDSDNGFDTTVSIQLKQYRDYATKTCNITFAGTKPTASAQNTRGVGDNAPAGGAYTVRSGDCLWKIAGSQLGNSSRWGEIYNLNRSVIGGNPNLIYPGQVLTLPAP